MDHALARLLESYGVDETGKDPVPEPQVRYLPHLDQLHVVFDASIPFRAIPIRESDIIVLKEADGGRVVGFRIRNVSTILSVR